MGDSRDADERRHKAMQSVQCKIAVAEGDTKAGMKMEMGKGTFVLTEGK